MHRNRFRVNKTNRCTEFQFYWYTAEQFHPTPGSKRSSQLHKMYQNRHTAKNSWWWAERLPETCRVVIPMKLESSASVGFIHKEFVTMHGHNDLKRWLSSLELSTICHSNAICTLRKSHCTCFEIWRNTILSVTHSQTSTLSKSIHPPGKYAGCMLYGMDEPIRYCCFCCSCLICISRSCSCIFWSASWRWYCNNTNITNMAIWDIWLLLEKCHTNDESVQKELRDTKLFPYFVQCCVQMHVN